MLDLIGLLVFLIGVAVFALIFWGLSRSANSRPVDDWAPLEAVLSRKFLGRTARSRRRWVRDPAGRERLIEATKLDVDYVLMVDGKQVSFVAPADLDGAMDDLERKVNNGSA